jgi:hypothetical protein
MRAGIAETNPVVLISGLRTSKFEKDASHLDDGSDVGREISQMCDRRDASALFSAPPALRPMAPAAPSPAMPLQTPPQESAFLVQFVGDKCVYLAFRTFD